MPASLTYPGVYIEELPSNVHVIAGVATSIAAFIGWAPEGPTNQAVMVESFPQFQSIFGGFTTGVYLAYAVNQFFANGGTQAYIVRLTWDGTQTPAPGTNPAVSTTALAAGIGFPSAQITASSEGVVSPPITIDIGVRVQQGLAITPANPPTLPLGMEVTFSASALFADGTTGTPTAPVTWTSSSPTIAIAAKTATTAVATANAVGTAVITAKSGYATASMTLTVSGLMATGLTINPASFSLAAGQQQQLNAVATLSDSSTLDVTSLVGWVPPAGVTISASGLAQPTGSAAANENVAAKLVTTTNTYNATAAVALGPPVPVSLAVYPAGAVATVGGPNVDYTVLATYSDGTVGALPASASPSWLSSNTTVAQVNASSGVASPGSAGVSVISVTVAVTASLTLTASATLTLTAATLKSFSVTPLNSSVAGGQSAQLSATAIYSDGTTVDLTDSVTWAPSTSVNSHTGLVTIATPGANNPITATVTWQSGTVSAQANVTVTLPVVKSIAISPPSSTQLASGQSAQLTAVATLSDGTTAPPSLTFNWNSSAQSIISVVPTTGVVTAAAAGGSLVLAANSPGAWGNGLLVSVLAPASSPGRFGLLVQQQNASGQISVLESFVNLSTVTTDPQYALTVVNNDSNYVTFVTPPTATPSPTASPIAFSGGADGAILMPAFDGNFEIALQNPNAGYSLLDRVDIFNLMCVPGETDETTLSNLQGFCVGKRAMLVVDAPPLSTAASLFTTGPIGTNPGAGLTTQPNSANSAYYFPWVLAPDPAAGNRPALFPPCGFVAGIYAATDAGPGVWKAPAGVNAGLTGDSGLQYMLTDAENGNLNPQAINCLRHFRVYGNVVWGARTLAGSDAAGSQWKYVPIRRTALYIESSLLDGTQWVVFEPNDETLWGQIRLNVGSFMQGLFLEGAFAGTSPQQAYFVKCDADNNPPTSVALGIVNILVGFAPLYPAEFVVIQIQQIAAQAS